MPEYLSIIKRKYIRLSEQGPILECLEHPGATAFLFYPGTMIEPGHYALFINCLYQAGFSVLAPHFAGHGLNKKKARTFQFMLEEGLMAEEWILKNINDSLVVGGHSQGGILSLAHGSRSVLPRAIFAFNACLPQLDSAVEATRFAPFAKHKKEILASLKKLASFFPNLPIPLPLYLSGHKILANCRKPIFTGKGETRISYPLKFIYSLFNCRISKQILSPLWLIGARGDALFNEKITNETFDALSAPKKTLTYLPEGGHLAILNPWLAKFAASFCACATLSLKCPLKTEIET